MPRLLRLSLLVALLASPAFVRAALPAVEGQAVNAADHPFVGAWEFDFDLRFTGALPMEVLVHPDETWSASSAYFGEGAGAWRPSGARTADATLVFQDLNPDPNLVTLGVVTAQLAIEVNAAGDAFTARWESEERLPDGTLAARDSSTARGVRLAIEPLPAATPGATTPTQPAQPASGPGSDDVPFPAARAVKHGPDPGGFWLWEPTTGAAANAPVAPGPFPVVLYIDGCCAGDYPNPPSVGAWLTHLTREGYVVIAPVYRATTVVADVSARLRDALAELARPGHAAIDRSRVVVAGYSFGGVPALDYAATAAQAGLPVPKALFVMAPCVDGALQIGASPGSTCQPLPSQPTFPAGLKALVLAFGQDFRVGIDMPRQVWGALGSLPAADHDFVVMASDGHGLPPVLAQHETPTFDPDAAAWYGIWKLSDALFACALDGKWCDAALGDTPAQRFMGIWSDGVPIVELQVTDAP